MHENDVLDAFIAVFVRALDKQTPLSSNHQPKDQRTIQAKNLHNIPGKTLSHYINIHCCILGVIFCASDCIIFVSSWL